MKRKTVHTNRIQVLDEAGQRHVIDEYTDFFLVQSLDGPEKWERDLRRFKIGGDPVNLVDAETFERPDLTARYKRVP
ncbi:hypothetical protein H0A70_07970 [Alcaligenaceae bacterium]|nr:hypothetical protein [Alcaligenaceae bacterium]